MIDKYNKLPDLLTPQEVADILKVENLTVRRYIKAGKMKAYKLPSGILRIPKEEIAYLFGITEEELLERGTIKYGEGSN